jgi:hypothetical protein
MAKMSKDAPREATFRGLERSKEEMGRFTVGFEFISEDEDLTPYFKGLPDDSCQAEHWGFVLKGRLGYRYPEGEEIIEAGEAYYARPGHTRIHYAGTELVEFSSSEELRKTVEVVSRNIERMQSKAA